MAALAAKPAVYYWGIRGRVVPIATVAGYFAPEQVRFVPVTAFPGTDEWKALTTKAPLGVCDATGRTAGVDGTLPFLEDGSTLPGRGGPAHGHLRPGSFLRPA